MLISKKLNPYLSDLVVMYLKLHDLHWNVKGMQFVPVHQYTESRYEDMSEKFDAVAELIIMQGEKPVSSIKEYLELASIKELAKGDYRDEEVLKIVLSDLEHLRAEALDIHESCSDNFSVVAMMEEHIAGYDKELWFLKSMMA